MELPFQNCESGYTGQEIEISELIQAYQSQFTPKGDETYEGVPNLLRPVKIDKLIEAQELEKFFSRWKPGWFTPDPNAARTGYLQQIYMHMAEKWIEELNLISWTGEYAAPTAGTAGSAANAIDGFNVKFGEWISDGILTPQNMGAVDLNNMVEYVRDYVKSTAMPYRYAPGIIFMSKTNAQAYADNYQELYPSRKVNEEMQDQQYLVVDHFNKRIKGLTSMEGSDRMFTVYDNKPSLIIGNRTGYPAYFQFRFEAVDRNLKMFAEIYRFYGMESSKNFHLSDQE